ncbi:hypothetical protein BH09PAT1_BH09PAT1_2440 [soil metagenome]
MKNIVIVCLILISTLIVLPTLGAVANSKTINVDEQKVVYQLPYPGILADHPLYPIKKLRDSILIFTTRDTLKKSELYHHLSDKHIAIAVQLADKGKEQLAINEFILSEEYFSKAPSLLRESKKQGVAPTNDFITKLYQSNSKHAEIITEFLKKTTQANIDTLDSLLKKNKAIRHDIGQI